MCVCFQQCSAACHNANYVPYAPTPTCQVRNFNLHCDVGLHVAAENKHTLGPTAVWVANLTLGCNGVFAINAVRGAVRAGAHHLRWDHEGRNGIKTVFH